MWKLNKSLTRAILLLFLVTAILSIILRGDSYGLIFGILSFVFLVDIKDIKKCDYIFVVSLVVGVIIMFINIFIKNTTLANVYSVYICMLALWLFHKK